jgi:hypothetical protein
MPFGIKIWWVDFHLWQGVPISEILSSMDWYNIAEIVLSPYSFGINEMLLKVPLICQNCNQTCGNMVDSSIFKQKQNIFALAVAVKSHWPG